MSESHKTYTLPEVRELRTAFACEYMPSIPTMIDVRLTVVDTPRFVVSVDEAYSGGLPKEFRSIPIETTIGRIGRLAVGTDDSSE